MNTIVTRGTSSWRIPKQPAALLCVALAIALLAPVTLSAVAVLPFHNSSNQPDLDPVADGLGDLLITCAQNTPGVTFVERVALDKVLAEQKISLAGLTDDKTKAQVGKLLGAKYIITGGLVMLDNKLTINARLFEVETSRVAKSSEATGTLDNLMETVQSLTVDLMKGIGIELKPLSAAEIDRSPEANLHFMRGLGYFYGNMKNQAISEFMKSLAIDPAQPRARWWNAACYYDQKEWEHAAIEYERFLKDFPKDASAVEAQKRLAQCKNMPGNVIKQHEPPPRPMPSRVRQGQGAPGK